MCNYIIVTHSKGKIEVGRKEKLIQKLFNKPFPKNFTKQDLDSLLSKCNCKKYSGGRGSSIAYYHVGTSRILQFDEPHPGNELKIYQVKATRKFLEDIGEVKE